MVGLDLGGPAASRGGVTPSAMTLRSPRHPLGPGALQQRPAGRRALPDLPHPAGAPSLQLNLCVPASLPSSAGRLCLIRCDSPGLSRQLAAG